jgi:Signal transduction histidine kinase regulating citrate/malate metabolism
MTGLYSTDYNMLITLISYFLMIVIYKYIFSIEISTMLLTVSLAMIIYMLADTFYCTIILQFTDVDTMRGNTIIQIASNLSIGLISYLISDIKTIKVALNNFILKASKNNYRKMIFFILIILAIIMLFYNFSSKFYFGIEFAINIMVLVFLIVLCIININEYLNNQRISDKYDNLVEYIQDFEDIVEKIQFDNHEHKNQLAVLKVLLSQKDNKNAQKYINDIIGNFDKINSVYMVELKNVPKGAIKGMLYYKLMLSKKNNIMVSVEVSSQVQLFLNNIQEPDEKLLCNIIGIYFDNAIESVLECEKKEILIEFYIVKNALNIAISNTYNKIPNINKLNEKGYSSKGIGRGKGLYFANKLISSNENFSNKTLINEEYFMQKIIYKKD